MCFGVWWGMGTLTCKEEPFERLLVERLKEFIREKMMMTLTLTQDMVSWELQDGSIDGENESEESNQIDEERCQEDVDKDIEATNIATQAGGVHLIGETDRGNGGEGLQIRKKGSDKCWLKYLEVEFETDKEGVWHSIQTYAKSGNDLWALKHGEGDDQQNISLVSSDKAACS